MIRRLIVCSALCLTTLAGCNQAHAISDQSWHYQQTDSAPHYSDPDEKNDFSGGVPDTSYPQDQTRSGYYLGDSASSYTQPYGFSGSDYTAAQIHNSQQTYGFGRYH